MGPIRCPALSSAGASRAAPCYWFHTPLIEPDVQIARIRLSDKTLTLSHTPGYATARGQTHEPEVPVQVREWISPASVSPSSVFGAQPPTQPRSGVAVKRAIRSAVGTNTEVVRPAAQRTI